MNRFVPLTLKMLTAVIVAASVLGPGAARAEKPIPPDPGGPVSCTLNLKYNINGCAGVAGLTVSLTPIGGTSATSTQAWLKATLGYGQRAVFTVRYDAVPSGWTVDIGDSSTNNGWAGDAGTQRNDAEMQVAGRSFTVYGRDGTPVQPLFNFDNPGLGPGSVGTFDVSDQKLCWNLPGTDGCLNSSYLYALNGQPDSEPGGVNFDIYAGFNRVISGPGSRVGSGVTSVTVQIWRSSVVD